MLVVSCSLFTLTTLLGIRCLKIILVFNKSFLGCVSIYMIDYRTNYNHRRRKSSTHISLAYTLPLNFTGDKTNEIYNNFNTLTSMRLYDQVSHGLD